MGSPLSGTGLAGTQVTGIATVSPGTAKTVYSDVSSPQNTVVLQDIMVFRLVVLLVLVLLQMRNQFSLLTLIKIPLP